MDPKSVQNIFWMTETDPTRFFHEKVVEAQERQKLKLTENVEFYIVNLLCGYVRTSPSKEYDDCLAFILKKALESSFLEKIALYKKLADTALYISGFFQEYFNRKSFDIKYYVNMGESAYSELSHLLKGKNTYHVTMSKIYREMSANFKNAVDILLDISEQTSNHEGIRSTLSLYDAWINTESTQLEKELLSRGVNPVKVPSRKVQ